MKKLITLVFIFVAFVGFRSEAQERYLDEVFTQVSVQTDIVYARNITVLTVSDPTIGVPVPQNIVMDVYSPAGDTETNRPLVILLHTGNFLPIGTNGTTAGTMDDFPVVEIANRLARMGYVVAMADYRQGWNPISDNRDERVSTLINAAYRGIQDARSCVRYFRKDAIDGNNQYGICPDRIAYWGVGTGGYISTAAAAIDQYSELVLPKFIDSTGVPMVIEGIHGDPFGTSVGLVPGAPSGQDTLSLPNHVGYDSDVQLAVNMGGAIGDTSWMDAGDPAYLCFHVPTDPFAPYKEDILTVPTTGDLIVEVQGSYLIAEKANALGLNAKFSGLGLSDEYTVAADANNEGIQGLFPFLRPSWPNPFDPTLPPYEEASPWDWWDSDFWSTQPHPSCPAGLPLSACNFDVISRLNNRDASETKGKTYIDSIMGYYAPRAYAQLDLNYGFCAPSNTDEVLALEQVDLKVAPNPSSGEMIFTTKENQPMERIDIFNLSGQLVKSHIVENNQFLLEKEYLNTGMYIAKVKFADGILAKKIIFE